MASSTPRKNRMDRDIIKLINSKYAVNRPTDSLDMFHVEFHGPKETLYEGGVWKIRVYLPPNYPFKSPSIGFLTRIFHPNIDEKSGSICLDVINQAWTPMYELVNIFDSFLPQLLAYPNAEDPLNPTAASLYKQKPDDYRKKVIEYVKRYAVQDEPTEVEQDDSDSGSSMSDADNDTENTEINEHVDDEDQHGDHNSKPNEADEKTGGLEPRD